MDERNAPELYTIWDEARSHAESGNHGKAIEIYMYILVRYADEKVAVEYANAYLGDIFLSLRQLDLAERHIKKALSYAPEKPGYYYILGFIYSVSGRWDKAIAELGIAVDRKPDDGEYLRALAWAIFNEGNQQKGLAYLNKANKLDPTNVKVLTDMAVAHLSMENMVKARKYAERAVFIDPENTLVREVLMSIDAFDRKFKELARQTDKDKTTVMVGYYPFEIYLFKVSLKEKPEIWRIIAIKGNQMLSSLHKAIFKAFDRFDEHLYSFFMSGKPYDRESEYISPYPEAPKSSKLATRIRIDSLFGGDGQNFLYLFDYGDEWWHDVEFIGISDKAARGNYPRVVKKQGKSPPQYSSEDS
jgi:tetratricopeptide (TPR) repeat protein